MVAWSQCGKNERILSFLRELGEFLWHFLEAYERKYFRDDWCSVHEAEEGMRNGAVAVDNILLYVVSSMDTYLHSLLRK